MKWLAIILTVLFVAFKLLGLITWSWWLVFTPFIMYAVIELIIFIVAFVITVISKM